MRCGMRSTAQRTIQRVCPLVKGWKIMLDEWTLRNPRVHQTLPAKAPISASTFWLETVQHLSEKQANSPDPRTRSLNGQEFLKKPKQAGCCFGNARKSLLPGDFWHTGSADNWTWRTLTWHDHRSIMPWRHKFKQILAQKCRICHPKWLLHVLEIQNLRYPSYTGKRHLVKSWNRPCGYLCFNFEETFNLQIPCQQTATVVVACKTFFRHHRVCERKLWHHWS